MTSKSTTTELREGMGPHWDTMARQWTHIGPPLRPCNEDLEVIGSAIDRPDQGNLRVLVLGVTREIVLFDWPQGTQLDAVERSPGMLARVWAGDIPGVRQAHHGEWIDLPFAENSYDIVVGDGCFTCVKLPDGYQEHARSIRRVLKPSGMLITRLFVSPEVREHPDDVIAELLAGRIGSFHVFKWRLAMAVQEDPVLGVRLHDIWQTWSNYQIETTELARRNGWSLESIHTINLYQNKEARFSFPQLEQAIDPLRCSFTVEQIYSPSYELGERCPTVILRPSKAR